MPVLWYCGTVVLVATVQKLVTAAIEEKLKAEQDSQRMEFVLEKGKLNRRFI